MSGQQFAHAQRRGKRRPRTNASDATNRCQTAGRSATTATPYTSQPARPLGGARGGSRHTTTNYSHNHAACISLCLDGPLDGSRRSRGALAAHSAACDGQRGPQFTCFTGAKVQILTLSAQQSLLERLQGELAQLEDDKLRLIRELTQQGAFCT